MHAHTNTGWFLHFSLVTVWISLFHLWHLQSNICFSQKQAEMRTRLTRQQVFTVYSVHLEKLTSGPGNSAEFLRKINKCLPLCIIQCQVAFLDAATDCVEWQWFSKVLLSPCGSVYHGSMTAFVIVCDWLFVKAWEALSCTILSKVSVPSALTHLKRRHHQGSFVGIPGLRLPLWT